MDQEPKIWTVAEYRQATPECTGDIEDGNGDALDDDAVITVFADETYCVGEWDGNQTCMDLC